MKYEFDKVIDRKEHHSAKWNEMGNKFGTDDLIPMWIADMDFKTAPEIIESMREKLEHGIFGYVNRTDEYYKTACNWLHKRHGWDISTENITYSPGVVPALSIIIQEFTKTGDKIIIQSPVYYPFSNVIEENNREIVLNPLKETERGYYEMDYDHLISKTDDVKFLILCNPHNPVGRVWKKEELEKLGKICFERGIKVISDEIHSDLILKESKHVPFASLGKEFEENTITCFAPTKTFNIAGLYSSFIVFPNFNDKDIFEEALGRIDLKRNNSFSLVATMAAYEKGEAWLEQLLVYLEENIDYMIGYIKENIPKIKVRKPEGTYLVWLDFRDYGFSKDELGRKMIEEAKIAFDDGLWFGKEGEGFQRINIACPRVMIEDVLKRLETVFKY